MLLIAIYHFEAKVISRGTGRSVVAAAAYASCSRIYNDYDGVTHDYTKKRGNLYSEVFLPSNAPPEWQDRSELWNAVEEAEKTKDSRLGRELITALPIELELEDWKSMFKDFIEEECTDKDMCADVSIHDTDGHNPHAHILLTIRPLDDKGRWQAKTQKEYLCKRGDEEQGFTAAEFKAAQADGWEKQYQYKVGKKKVYMTPSEAEAHGYERANKYPKSTRYGRQNPICAEWNCEEQVLRWRKAWEEVTNKALEQNSINARIDCRSFKERGITEQPTIHEGVAAQIMEQCGIVSDGRELNRQIREDNKLLRELKAAVQALTDKVKNSAKNIAAKLEALRGRMMIIQYQLNLNTAQSKELKTTNTFIDQLLKRYRSIVKDIKAKTAERKGLQSEKRSLTPVHIIRHNKLSSHIAELTENIEELKSQKNIVLKDMYCETDKQVSGVEQRRNKNADMIKQLDKCNLELTEQKKNTATEFEEVRSGIAPEDADTVQEERLAVCDEVMSGIRGSLQELYGRKYSYDGVKAAEDTVCRELNEPLSTRKSVLDVLRRKRQERHTHGRAKQDEPEL